MKGKFKLPRLNPQLAAELRPQKGLIVRGLVLTALLSALSAAQFPLLASSLRYINDAAPYALSEKDAREKRLKDYQAEVKTVSQSLKLPQAQADGLADRTFDEVDRVTMVTAVSQRRATAEILAHELQRSPAEVERALPGQAHSEQGDPAPLRKLALNCFLVVLLFGLRYFCTRGSVFMLSRAAINVSNGLRRKLFLKLQRLPISYFGEKRAGAIHSVLTNDVSVFTGAISVLKDSIEAPLTILFSIGYIVYTSPSLAIIGLLFVLPMVQVIQRNSRKVKTSQRKVQNALADLSATTSETLQGVRVIKAFAAEAKIEADYERQINEAMSTQVRNARVTSALRPLVELMGAAALALLLYICGWMSFKGTIDLGKIAAVIFAFDRINQSLRAISSITNTMSQIDAAGERINREVLDVPDQVEDASSGRTLPHPTGRIEFQNVSFRYPDGTEALKDVSFTLEPGTSLALVGTSGAGKSTIADLLLRFYDPTEGQILFDGVDVRELNLAWLRKQIGVVPQQTFLFAGTIAENIRLGAQGASDEEVREAAELAHVVEFVDALPAGFDSPLGEGGAGLSGGQRQRVAIARALVRKPALLLLDEATSALDAESERAVTEALDEVMTQRTTLFIAHRLTTAARADRILVLSRGKAIESGSHAELLARGDAYAGLFKAFSGGVL